MSELNDLIASSSVHAFNSGVEQGRMLERNRILADLLDLLDWQQRLEVDAQVENDAEGVTYWRTQSKNLNIYIKYIEGIYDTETAYGTARKIRLEGQR